MKIRTQGATEAPDGLVHSAIIDHNIGNAYGTRRDEIDRG